MFHTRRVETKLKKEGEFCKPAVQYMGPFVSCDGLALDPNSAQCIRKLPIPRTPTEVLACVGLC